MDLSEAIVLASVIITLGGLAITVSLITKKKGLAIFLFVFFVVMLAFIFIFKDMITSIMSSSNRNDFYTSKGAYKTILIDGFNDKPKISDVIFTYGEPFALKKDSSLLFYSSYLNIKELNNKDNYIYYGHEEEKIAKEVINDENTTHKIDLSSGAIFIINNNILETAFIIGEYNAKLNHKIYGWPMKSMEDNFGNKEGTWISTDYKTRIYKINNYYFFFNQNQYYGLLIDYTGSFDPMNFRNNFIDIFYNQKFTKE